MQWRVIEQYPIIDVKGVPLVGDRLQIGREDTQEVDSISKFVKCLGCPTVFLGLTPQIYDLTLRQAQT
jgi:hypothetical protein